MKLRTLFSFAALFSLPASAQNPGDQLFAAPIVHDINIILPQNNYWDSLLYYKSWNDTAAQYIYMQGDVIIDGTPVNSSGVRLKGNASYSHPGKKKSIVLSFNEFIGGQDYDGLRSFHLDNSAYDPTMLREKIYLDILNRNGLPAPRCAFARVSYNGEYVGLYKIIESVNKQFLQAHFGNDERNLFKGDPHAPLIWEGSAQQAYYDNFELKTNESVNDWSDLVQLINVINNSGTNFSPQIEQAFNVRDYLRAWAANNLFGNYDSYMYLPHNYYLYNDSLAGKFQWITWDVGIVFGVLPVGFQNNEDFPLLYLPDPPQNLPLNNNLLSVEAYKQEYLNDVCTFFNNDLIPSRLFAVIDSLAAVIRPHVYAEPDGNQMYTEQQFENNLGYGGVSSWLVFQIPGLKDFISQRRGKVSTQLCEMDWSCALGQSFAGLSDDQVISIYPNPTSEKVTISYVAPQYEVQTLYELSDMRGRILLRENVALQPGETSRTIDVSRLRAGVYYLRVIAGCRNTERKIVVVR